MPIRSVKSAPIRKGTRVILRADFDVVIKKGKIADDFRIRETIPTIKYILKKGGNVLILTKRGHLKVRRSEKMSTKVLLPYLRRALKTKVSFMGRPLELKVFSSSKKKGEVFLFENLRFWPEEEANNLNFAKRFARAADLYVSDNFGTSHRSHASVVGIPKYLPSWAGFLLEREIQALEKVVKNPRRPLVAILGGAKLETKLPVVRRFFKYADTILVGGAIANALLKNPKLVMGKKLYLPVDGSGQNTSYNDIGPKTVRCFTTFVRNAKTIVWNGPLGRAEDPRFAYGTKSLAHAVKRSGAFTVVGGGDTVAILKKYRLIGGFDHVSTGGGAMLEFLAGKKLPGIEALKRKA